MPPHVGTRRTQHDESSPLLGVPGQEPHHASYDGDVESIISNPSHVSKDERTLHTVSAGAVGERLPYSNYATIDWLHDLVKDTIRHRRVHSSHALDPSTEKAGWRNSLRRVKRRLYGLWDRGQGWAAALLIGLITAIIAFVVDVSVATVADWKQGWCASGEDDQGWWLDSERCKHWRPWTNSWGLAYAVYVVLALVYGLIAGGVTMTTRSNLPAAEDAVDSASTSATGSSSAPAAAGGKMMYMAAGSGIPEIKTILSGFVIPHFLDFKVLLVKAVGATFAVATGMNLGKEGPFVHISTCVGYLVARMFPKYRENERKMREMLSVACSAGLSVAFGAPIGGVLFSYEEISTYFPRRVLWKAFLCSLVAAAALKELNPTGTGKLVLFETNYGTDYDLIHYLVFILLGICGGIFGGVFCQANYRWAKFFRAYPIIKNHPVFEVFLVVLVTALLQYPNQLIRQTGDKVMSQLLVDCRTAAQQHTPSYVCEQEALEDRSKYYIWLTTGTLTKLILTIITFGCKVPSGIIIPSLDAGALFGRMIGQLIPDISPGIFAMVGAAAFLAGVSRMTVSLAVIMFELTGEVNFIPPFMTAILTAKWVADAISSEGVYDLSQTLLGHPFLDCEHAIERLRDAKNEDARMRTVKDLVPPRNTMEEISLYTGPDYKVSRDTLVRKLAQLRARGLMDAGLVLLNDRGVCHGYLPEAELDFALNSQGDESGEEHHVGSEGEIDLLSGVLADFVDRTPLTITSNAPVEYAVEMFGRLGLRYLIIVEEDSARVIGVVIKKRLVKYIEELDVH